VLPPQLHTYRLVVLAPSDVPAQQQLLRQAAACAHAVADVAPLGGRTVALDGRLTITVRKAPAAAAAAAEHAQRQAPGWLSPGGSSVWFFRAGDVGVRWLSEVASKELMA
jgi:hypothetical protein